MIRTIGKKRYDFQDDGSIIQVRSKQCTARQIGEEVLGRRLRSTECVHHIDKNRKNNRHTNLLICLYKYHGLLHRRMRLGKEVAKKRELLETVIADLKREGCFSHGIGNKIKKAILES